MSLLEVTNLHTHFISHDLNNNLRSGAHYFVIAANKCPPRTMQSIYATFVCRIFM